MSDDELRRQVAALLREVVAENEIRREPVRQVGSTDEAANDTPAPQTLASESVPAVGIPDVQASSALERAMEPASNVEIVDARTAGCSPSPDFSRTGLAALKLGGGLLLCIASYCWTYFYVYGGSIPKGNPGYIFVFFVGVSAVLALRAIFVRVMEWLTQEYSLF